MVHYWVYHPKPYQFRANWSGSKRGCPYERRAHESKIKADFSHRQPSTTNPQNCKLSQLSWKTEPHLVHCMIFEILQVLVHVPFWWFWTSPSTICWILYPQYSWVMFGHLPTPVVHFYPRPLNPIPTSRSTAPRTRFFLWPPTESSCGWTKQPASTRPFRNSAISKGPQSARCWVLWNRFGAALTGAI